jgi:YVTN family beta-propeller protein
MAASSKQSRACAEGGLSGRFFALCLAIVALSGCRPHDFPQFPANYREYAYVTNGDSGTVSVLDVVNVRIDREVLVGRNPVAVAVNPARPEVYVVNSGSAEGRGSLSILNAENNTVVATIPLHAQPLSIDIDAAHQLAYIANSGSNTISVVNLARRAEIAQIGTGEQPVEARVAPDGNSVVVPNRSGNSVCLIDAASRRVRAIFEGCPGAADTVILPDSSKAFVACSGGHQVMAIGLARGQQADRLEAMMDVGHAPAHLALKPDGGELFVSNSLSDTISEVVTTTNDVGGAYLMGDNPVQGLVSSDNSLLYEANLRAQDVTMYAIDDGRRATFPGNPSGSIHVGDGPSAMAFSAEGHLLFVVDTRSGDVAVVRTLSHALFTMLPTGRGPNAIAVKGFRVQ